LLDYALAALMTLLGAVMLLPLLAARGFARVVRRMKGDGQ
jgi:hypothetical protein